MAKDWPALGTRIQLPDGSVRKYRGGDPHGEAAWETQAAGGAGPAKPVPMGQDPIYRKKFLEESATRDSALVDKTRVDAKVGRDLIDTSASANALLDQGTPTGFGGTLQAGLGKLAAKPLGWLPGIPNEKETTQMLKLRRLGGKGILNEAAALKPFSNTDRDFLATMQYSVGSPAEYNREVAKAQDWAGRKLTNYHAGLKAWSDTLGSPEAVNSKNQSFDEWWDGWSREHLPPPDVQAPSKKAAANAQLKAKSAQAPVIQRARKSGQAQIIGIE